MLTDFPLQLFQHNLDAYMTYYNVCKPYV